jgi:uridine kinase
MPTVVAIAGVAGAGKSSVVSELVKMLPDADAIHIDDYQRITREPLGKLQSWVDSGADFDEFEIPVLGEHLARLRNGEPVTDPIRMRTVEPGRFVVFETHFGRAHRDTGQHIDVLVWLEVDLDIALARNLRSLIQPMLPGGGLKPDAERLLALNAYLERYVGSVRPLLELQLARVREEADFCVPGGLTPRLTAEAIVDFLGGAGL